MRGIDLGRICGVTFSDVAGAFVVGMMLGAIFALLMLFWLRNSRRQSLTKGENA